MAQGSAVSGVALAATPYPGGKWEPGPARYGVIVEDNIPVTMEDGTVLRASVAWPSDPATGKRAAGKFPVMVEHTPYVELSGQVHPIPFFPEHGYIYAVVRARGMGASGGEAQYATPRDGQDGKAIVDWAAHRLSGSDGRLALVGCSYPAALAMTDAAHLGPRSPVKAVVAACNGLVPQNRETFMMGGFPMTNLRNMDSRLIHYVGDTFSARTLFNGMSDSIFSGGDAAYDRQFWRDRQPTRIAAQVVKNGLPVLLWSGWKDAVEIAAVRTYSAFQNAYAGRPVDAAMTTGQKVSPRYQIIVGGWGHAAGLDAGLYLQWIETWLKGVDTGLQHTSTPMHLYEAGTGRWINTSRFPATGRYTVLRLGKSGALGGKGAIGQETLSFAEPSQKGAALSFTTSPFAKGATLSGPMSATIHARSSNTNLALIAHLYDVAPDGATSEITKGIVLGSQHQLDAAKSWRDRQGTAVWPWPRLDRDEPLVAGRAYRFDIALSPRQYGVQPGHRLRLELTTRSPLAICPEGATPAGLPPGGGTDPCELTAPQKATLPGGRYTILYGPVGKSSLNLPLLPYRYFSTVRSGELPTPYSEGRRRLEDKGEAQPLDW